MAEEKVEESGTYEAGCHCGYIKFSVTLSPPLPEYKVLDCNCSMCRKAGYLLICKSHPVALPPARLLPPGERMDPLLHNVSVSGTGG